jgi:tetratricopeptide (TPR) repeat protein
MAEDDPAGRWLDVPEVCPDLPPAEPDADPLLDHLSRVRSNLDRERAAAPERVAELLALPPEQWEERLRRSACYQTWGVCELLLARSAEAADAAAAGRLAALSLAGADRLDPALHASSVVADLRARAWAAAGDARRRQGKLAEAEQALRDAAACLAQGTGDLLVEARLLAFEAALRREQGRTGEAVALLKMAAARYRETGEVQLCERTLAEREEILRQERAVL